MTNMNHYQSGETLGKHKAKYGFSYGMGQFIKSEVHKISQEVDSEIPTYLEYEENTEQIFIVNLFRQIGMSNKLDLLTEVSLSLFYVSPKIGFKHNLLSDKFHLSVMPEIGYSFGSNTKASSNFGYPFSDNISASAKSNTINMEVLFPMSYDFSDRFSLHWSISAAKHIHTVKANFDPGPSGEFDSDFFIPGISMGCRWNNIFPELKAVYTDDEVMLYFGMAFKTDKFSFDKRKK
jgi:hypothetical protein